MSDRKCFQGHSQIGSAKRVFQSKNLELRVLKCQIFQACLRKTRLDTHGEAHLLNGIARQLVLIEHSIEHGP